MRWRENKCITREAACLIVIVCSGHPRYRKTQMTDQQTNRHDQLDHLNIFAVRTTTHCRAQTLMILSRRMKLGRENAWYIAREMGFPRKLNAIFLTWYISFDQDRLVVYLLNVSFGFTSVRVLEAYFELLGTGTNHTWALSL